MMDKSQSRMGFKLQFEHNWQLDVETLVCGLQFDLKILQFHLNNS